MLQKCIGIEIKLGDPAVCSGRAWSGSIIIHIYHTVHSLIDDCNNGRYITQCITRRSCSICRHSQQSGQTVRRQYWRTTCQLTVKRHLFSDLLDPPTQAAPRICMQGMQIVSTSYPHGCQRRGGGQHQPLHP